MAQISNPADRKKIKDALIEISDSMTRMEAEKDLIKEIVNELADNFELPKKAVTKMARMYHKQNFHKEQQENDELENLYLSILETKQE